MSMIKMISQMDRFVTYLLGVFGQMQKCEINQFSLSLCKAGTY